MLKWGRSAAGIAAILVISTAPLCAQAVEGKAWKALTPRVSSAPAASEVISGTVKILAVRVEFQPDTMATTTGDGSFGSGIPDTARIDPLPHNRRYFQDQLLFLKNFYEDISEGGLQLEITDTVYPLEPDSAYRLPYPMWHYNYNNDDYLDLGLARLYRDAWFAAAEDTNIHFEDFDPEKDCFIIFHAGVGKDFAFDFDPTPFDIPSAYLELADLDTLPEFIPGQGLPVRDGAYHLQRGLILPETENQEGYELGMHGHMAILFGHHIGLPNLYDTETGTSVLGWFGLMDQGSGKVDGLIPAPPSAWTKVFAGWIEPVEITQYPDNIQAPVGAVFKIPLTDREYFLVENIDSYVREGVSWDSLQYSYYKTYNDYPVTLDLLLDSVAQYLNIDIDPVSGVLTDCGNWGIGRPASGLMIWHIDETVMAEEDGWWRINTDSDRRGVRLMEADGAYDIGMDYGLFSAGRGTELGSPYDAFYQGNPQHLDANPGSWSVKFSDNTFPSAKSNIGGFSHLLLKDFSPIADTMSFTVSHDIMLPGFPKPNMFLSFTADIDGDGYDELFAAAGDTIYGWRGDGSAVPVMSGGQIQPYFTAIDANRSIIEAAAADFDDDGREELAILDTILEDSTTHRLVIIDYLPEDSTVQIIRDANSIVLSEWGFPPEFFIGADSLVYSGTIDSVFCWSVNDCQPHLRWRKGIQAPSACLMPDGSIVASNDLDDTIYRISPSSNIIWSLDSPFPRPPSVAPPVTAGPVAADIDRDGEMEIIIVYQEARDPNVIGASASVSLLIVNSNGTVEAGYPVLLSDDTIFGSLGGLSLADIDDDGWLEIIFPVSGQGVWAFERNGVINDFFPYPDAGAEGSVLVGEDAAGRAKMFYISRNLFGNVDEYSLRAIDYRGNREPGFPIGIDRTYQPFRLGKVGDGSTILTYCAMPQDGPRQVFAYRLDPAEILWGSPCGDKANTALLDTLYMPLTSGGGLMPEGKVYNWPNPNEPGENVTHIRYFLNDNASVNIRIYDMAGDQVDELTDSGSANAWNETDWNIRNISSGVYLARVEAKGAGQTTVRFIKIAVIK